LLQSIKVSFEQYQTTMFFSQEIFLNFLLFFDYMNNFISQNGEQERSIGI